MDNVRSLSSYETAEGNDRLRCILDGSVFIQRHRNIIAIIVETSGFDISPTHGFKIKLIDRGIITIFVTASNHMHFVAKNCGLMVRDRAYISDQTSFHFLPGDLPCVSILTHSI